MFSGLRLGEYFPTITARRLRAAAGITDGSVMMACASARPHLQSRSAGIARTASRITFCAFSALRLRLADDFLQRDRAVLRMPAIVVGDHGHGGVAELGFAGQLGFGDDWSCRSRRSAIAGARALRPGWKIAAPRCTRRCRRDAPSPSPRRTPRRALPRVAGRWACRSPRAPRCRRRKMWSRAVTRAVEKLIGDQEVEGRQLLPQRADGAHGNHALHAQHASWRRILAR